MTRQPVPLHNRVAFTIKDAATKLAVHAQQIVTLQSKVAAGQALQPGDWAPVSLAAGWLNVGGAIPAQARLLTSTTVQVIGNISGGTIADGTVIGTLAPGFFNTVHTHTFDAVAVAGAAAVPVAGTVTGSSDDSALTDGTITGSTDDSGISNGDIQGNSDQAGLANGNIQGTSASASGPGSHTHGDGSYTVINGQHTHGSGGFTVINGHHTHGATNSTGNLSVKNAHHVHTSSAMASSVPVNYNKPSITLGTDGSLMVMNFHPAVTHISFHESALPLFTA